MEEWTRKNRHSLGTLGDAIGGGAPTLMGRDALPRFQSAGVFTSETKEILRGRVVDGGFPERFAAALLALLVFYLHVADVLTPSTRTSGRARALLDTPGTPPAPRRLAPRWWRGWV